MTRLRPILHAALLALLLSGCLDAAEEPVPDPSDDGNADVGGDPEDRSEADPSHPSDPGPSGTDPSGSNAQNLDAMAGNLEAVECTFSTNNIRGLSEPARQRLPEGLNLSGNGTTISYYLYVYECRSAILGDRLLKEDFWFAMVEVSITTPPEGASSENHGFALEAFTNWPELEEAWGPDGWNLALAQFTRTQGQTGPTIEIATPTLRYATTSAGQNNVDPYPVTHTLTLYADRNLVYDYELQESAEPLVPWVNLVTPEGGVLGEAAPETSAAPTLSTPASFVLHQRTT